jgi:hypothetical protein
VQRVRQEMIFTIDLDIFRSIKECPGVHDIRFRQSASGGGFHFMWSCRRRNCVSCRNLRKRFDDPARLKRDTMRGDSALTNILWDVKHGKRAGRWKRLRN